MKIIWRDTNLKQHEIDLKDAVDVRINGIDISVPYDNSIRIKTINSGIITKPLSVNCIDVYEDGE